MNVEHEISAGSAKVWTILTALTMSFPIAVLWASGVYIMSSKPDGIGQPLWAIADFGFSVAIIFFGHVILNNRLIKRDSKYFNPLISSSYLDEVLAFTSSVVATSVIFSSIFFIREPVFVIVIAVVMIFSAAMTIWVSRRLLSFLQRNSISK